MKIAQIVCTFPPYSGGIGNSAYTIGELLSSTHQVDTFFPKYQKKTTPIKGKQNFFPLKPFIKYGNGASLVQILWKINNYDCFYLHYPFFGTAELIWLKQLFSFQKKRLIIHYHMDVVGLKGLTKLLSLPSILILNNLFKKADIIVTSSLDYIENSQIAGIYKKYPSKFREIPFGIDTKKFCFKKRTSNKIKQILFVGGLDKAHYFKGLDNLIEAAQLIPGKDWQISIVGDGNLKPYYQKRVKNAKLENKIIFRGKVSDEKLISLYQKSDIFVLPSVDSSEAFGIVLIEAMACGLPVIASNLPGVREVFTHNLEGFSIPPNDIKALANKIKILLENESKKEKMGQLARKKAKNRYSLDIMQKKLNIITQ